MNSELFDFQPGNSTLVVSCPHPGTYIPEAIFNRLSDTGRKLIDTDWHVDKLYDFLPEFDATFIRANISRYVADLNRDPEGHALYPGRFETAMCPVVTFVGDAIYQRGEAPSTTEIAERHAHYWQPYHTKLSEVLARTKARHGYALLLDAHSIISHVPSLFEGRLPELNLGTDDGKSCAPEIERAASDSLQHLRKFSFVANGRFKGGYITRHYGSPTKHIHALQLEIAFRAYLDEENFTVFESNRAALLKSHLRRFVEAIVNAGQAIYQPVKKSRS